MSGGSGGRSAEAAAERRAAAGPAAACAWSAVDSSARHIRDAVYSLQYRNLETLTQSQRPRLRQSSHFSIRL